ncbi:hypothetical protein [Cupriavidus pampae]|uniref:Uncharacterized protein n=1 Tax=Cupriavidus pampae TaxID=659251 RepID=A0ABM8W8S0_9BURK|nr:hypothetical protein [Cupriavidus pampae]CAG9163584.1 hypothetical protein LMG32289_00088 [Cupriavidus pampae]
MSEPKHDEALVNNFLERISALSVSAFDGADVSGELAQIMREAASRADAGTLQVLAQRLRERAEAAEREGQAVVRDTFAKAATLAK